MHCIEWHKKEFTGYFRSSIGKVGWSEKKEWDRAGMRKMVISNYIFRHQELQNAYLLLMEQSSILYLQLKVDLIVNIINDM